MDQELKQLFRDFLKTKSSLISRKSFEQEPHYTAALFGKLTNERIVSQSGQFLELQFSSSNDRGPNSAEKPTGIDIGMVFRWEDPDSGVVLEKAVLMQAKNTLFALDKSEAKKLELQCAKMAKLTSSYVAMDCPYDGSVPLLCQSVATPPFWGRPSLTLDDYLIDVVFQCKDGDVEQKVIDIAKLANRNLTFVTNSPKPKPKKSFKLKK